MKEIFRRIVAGLPERRQPAKNSFLADPKGLRVWIGQLPLANPGATARMLHNTLREMNQLRIDPGQRLESLEQLRSPIGQIITMLDGQVISDSFPLPPQKQQLGHLAQEFQRELAIGYSAALCDMCAATKAIPFMKGKLVALAATRAIQHHGARLAKAYLLYHTPAVGVWQSLHDLYRFSVSVHVDDKAVVDGLLGGVQISARMAYAHALLLALTNPYRFSQRENLEVYAITNTWAPYCEIRPGVEASADAIAVRMDSDQGPGYLPQERQQLDAGVFAFETAGLQRFIDGQLAVQPSGSALLNFRLRGGPVVHAEVGLVERILQNWTARSERVLVRLPAEHKFDTVLGLHNLHYVLAGNQDFEDFLFGVRATARDTDQRDSIAAWSSGSGDHVRVVKQRATVMDQSMGGYRLVWEKGESVRTKIGELVGLAPLTEIDEPQDWLIGIIRWIRIEDSGAVGVGVKLLTRRAQPIALRSLDDTAKARNALRAILLDPLIDGASLVTVLAPNQLERDAVEFELLCPPDPFIFRSTFLLQKLSGITVTDHGGLYLSLDIPAASILGTAENEESATAAVDTAT